METVTGKDFLSSNTDGENEEHGHQAGSDTKLNHRDLVGTQPV